MDKARLDKWLWSVRIFKSRTMASDVCRSNGVKIRDKSQKPSFLISIGDIIEVKKNGFNLVFEVIKLIDKRVSAPLAQECFRDLTTAEELNKFDDWFVGKGRMEQRDRGLGRPTKRQRRDIEDYKLRQYDLFD